MILFTKKKSFFLFLYLLLLKESIFTNLFWRNIPIQILFLKIIFYKIIKKFTNLFTKEFFQFIYKGNYLIIFIENMISTILFKKKYQFNYYLGKLFCNFYLKSNLLVFIWKRNYAIVLFRKWFFLVFLVFLLLLLLLFCFCFCCCFCCCCWKGFSIFY